MTRMFVPWPRKEPQRMCLFFEQVSRAFSTPGRVGSWCVGASRDGNEATKNGARMRRKKHPLFLIGKGC